MSDLDSISILTNATKSIDSPIDAAFLLFDKPKGWSSFRPIKLVRWASGIKKVGHAGTLDPMATGLLVIGMGKATKKIDSVQADSKEYIATLKFGEATPSYDAETEVIETKPFVHITLEAIQSAISTLFLGEIDQKPPIFSALKKDGKRLYEYARKGQEVEIKSRKVQVYSIEILNVNLPEVELRIHCGKGTYIRSIAHDLGKALNSCAHLIALRRTKIGDFNVENALTEEEVKILFKKNDQTRPD